MIESSILTAPSATHAAVVGGGTMGADVAVVLLRAHCPVCIIETRKETHQAIRDKIAGNLADIGKADHINLLTLVARLDDVDWPNMDLVIECIPEQLTLKRDLFKSLVEHAPGHTVLASNSSSFPISQIADGLPTRERMIGLHFFMPAHIVPLAEVVLGPDTNPDMADSLVTFIQRCGSVPILVRKDVPGFVANRLQHALAREAYTMIEDGIVSPEDLDKAVRFGFGFRYIAAGPIMQKEHAGFDVHAAAAATIYPSLSNTVQVPAVLADKPRKNQLGMKTGQGFYSWTPETADAERKRYNAALRAGLKILEADLPAIEP